MRCLNCGELLNDNDRVCMKCGKRILMDLKAKHNLIPLVMGLVSVILTFVLLSFCKTIYPSQLKFTMFCAAIIVISGLGILSFFGGRISASAVVGFAISIIILIFLLLFSYVLIPNALDKIETEFLKDLEDPDLSSISYEEMNCFPYKSMYDFYYYEKDRYLKVEDYLFDLYNRKKYEKWILASAFVNDTILRKSYYDNLYSDRFMNSLWDGGYDVDLSELYGYMEVLRKTEALLSGDGYISGLNKDLEEYGESIKTGGYWLNIITYKYKCRINDGLLLYRCGGMSEEYIYVINLNTGSGFCDEVDYRILK